ncbi:DUF1007 family protein [Cocleimonas sp. KMM 6892]|uniref:DUF1007 family protein n=1 Tax=unclassified Cocleimonas TaxID=2639732 RepID=UPI002DBFB395|nr:MULTISPECIES: DUF1007 family protein [unclassified Cocleimonas]MEB8433199.1 DUF1007 family protein [Cocleimonas sp. KMM 6892]MEC4715820.1 DUF1007 family protein [Cocleimonas sp. KMM 6895]MEC4745281.1 DUF1007 family protein [Cocleimonas sp. KMM 6896]
MKNKDTMKTFYSSQCLLIHLLILFLFTIPQTAFAHFHYEISLTSHLQANAQKQLDSIKMTWTYDDNVSKLMLQDDEDISDLRERLIKELGNFLYFTSLTLNDLYLETKQVTTYELQEIQHQNKTRLQLTMTLALKEPVSLEGNNTLEIEHEDISASAIMFYETPAALSIDERLNKNCRVDIKDKEKYEEGEPPQIVKVICLA